jgi:hypothetical protein
MPIVARAGAPRRVAALAAAAAIVVVSGCGYELSLAGGPICGRVNRRVLAAVNADGGATITPPTTNAQGGFGGYRPLPELPPRAGYLIALDAAG